MASAIWEWRCVHSCRRTTTRRKSASQTAGTATSRFSSNTCQTATAHRSPRYRSPRRSAARQLPPCVRSPCLTSVVRLACELQQRQNINPQQSHEMPIPGSDIDHNPARCQRPVQYDGHSGRQQGQDSSEQMHSVRAREQIHEGTAGTRGDVEAARRQIPPGQPLSGQKTQSKHNGQRQPWKFPFRAQGYSWNGLDGFERDLPRKLPPRKLDGYAAQQQHARIDQKQKCGQPDGDPVVHHGVGVRVEGRQPLTHNVGAGEGNEQHSDRRQSHSQSEARPAQTCSVVRRAGIRTPAVSATYYWRQIAAFSPGGGGVERRDCWSEARHTCSGNTRDTHL